MSAALRITVLMLGAAACGAAVAGGGGSMQQGETFATWREPPAQTGLVADLQAARESVRRVYGAQDTTQDQMSQGAAESALDGVEAQAGSEGRSAPPSALAVGLLDGVAMVAVRDREGRVRSVRVGEELGEGWVLVGTDLKQVAVEREGERENQALFPRPSQEDGDQSGNDDDT